VLVVVPDEVLVESSPPQLHPGQTMAATTRAPALSEVAERARYFKTPP
jgi:hypothetical protein